MKSIRLAPFSFVAIAVALIAIPLLLVSSVAANKRETGPRAAWLALNYRAAGKLNAAWNDATGIPNFVSGADAATRIPYNVKPDERGKPELIARGFLAENAALFKIGAGDSFTLRRIEADKQLNYAHVRLDQTFRNIPVHAQQLIVHIDAQENIVAVNGQFIPNLNVMTEPLVSKSDAEKIARDDLLNGQLQANERARVTTKILDKTALEIYIDDANPSHATLTWYVVIMTEHPLGEWRYFVNAHKPVVTHRFNNVANDKIRETYTANNDTDIPGRLIISEGERSTRDKIAQAAHDGAGKVYDYYLNTFRRDSIDGQGAKMVSTVHYGSDVEDADNAAWIGEYQQMIYGDGGKIFKPLPYGLDVIGHEFTHGVIGATAGLEYKGQSGALNESYADIFGAMIDRGNWTIAEQVIKSPPFPRPFLRSLEDPNMKGAFNPRKPLGGVGQPAHVSEFANLPINRKNDNGGVHINSGIPNKAAYLIAKAIGPEKAEQVFYRALTQYLTPSSQFQDNALALIQSYRDLYGNDVQAIQAGLDGVGIQVSGANNVPAPPPTSPGSTTNAPPPPPQNVPQGCTNLVVNGTFETDEGWGDISGERTELIDTELPHTGKRSAWLGGQDQEAVNYIYQDISIPANATRVQLEYFRFLHEETSGFGGLLASDAKFGAVVADTKGKILGAVEKLVSSQADDRWQARRADLTQFAGKKIRLAFTSENPRGNISSMFVDDVVLNVCTTGNAPSAPQAAANSVYLQGTIVNADTQRGVQGAQVFIMKPGLSASDAAADDQITRGEVFAMAVSDGDGLYQTDVALPVGRAYSVIIIASGFRPIVADDGINIPTNAENPFIVNATLRKSR
ncbi:MAG: M4 family metallopeptidase [Chloroflexi bacterium]|nr:M4 family metallopeptidase [Chloroflexota bacterium]